MAETVYLDGGDALFHQEFNLPGGDERAWLRERAKVVAKELARMNPAALGVGRKDLADGLDFLVNIGEAEKLPFVSANILRENGMAPFPPVRYFNWNKKRVAVFGLTYGLPERDKDMGIRVTDPFEAAKATLESVKDADFVILLTDIGFDAEHELARKVKGINLIIGGGSGQRLLTDPDRVENTLLVRSSDRGRHLGVLDLESASVSKDWRLPVGQNQTRAMKAELANISREIKNEEAKGGPDSAAKIAKLKKASEDISKSLENVTAGTASYKHSISILDTAVQDEPATAKAVAALGQNPAEKRREEAAKAAKALAASNQAPPPKPSGQETAKPKVKSSIPSTDAFSTGTVPCRKCHQKPYTAWLATPHYRSGASVSKEKASGECYSCHYSRLTFQTGIAIEQMVGCEVCHGKGSKHEGKTGITRKPDEALCRKCHSGYHKKEFDFKKSYEEIRCDRK